MLRNGRGFGPGRASEDLEGASGWPSASTEKGERRADKGIALAGGGPVGFATALPAPRSDTAPGRQAAMGGPLGHVHAQFGEQDAGRDVTHAWDGHEQIETILVGSQMTGDQLLGLLDVLLGGLQRGLPGCPGRTHRKCWSGAHRCPGEYPGGRGGGSPHCGSQCGR
jgi:hypothetical protein